MQLPDMLHLCGQLLDALEYIHARGIVHCNVNPQSMYLEDDKGLRLHDFTCAMSEDDAVRLPEGRVVGELPFMAPEQAGFTDFKPDTRSDLYCVGMFLYRMVAGRHPFLLNDNSINELLDRELRTVVQPLRQAPLSVNAILIKALMPTPRDRYQTAAGFKHDIMTAKEHVKTGSCHDFTAGRRDAVVAVNRMHQFSVRHLAVEELRIGRQVPSGEPGCGLHLREIRHGEERDREGVQAYLAH